MRGRCSSMVKRVVRSTSVPIAEFDATDPMIRSPSQWPGTARSSTSAGRWLIGMVSGSFPTPDAAIIRARARGWRRDRWVRRCVVSSRLSDPRACTNRD